MYRWVVRVGGSEESEREAAIKPAHQRRIGRDVFKTHSSAGWHTHTIKKVVLNLSVGFLAFLPFFLLSPPPSSRPRSSGLIPRCLARGPRKVCRVSRPHPRQEYMLRSNKRLCLPRPSVCRLSLPPCRFQRLLSMDPARRTPVSDEQPLPRGQASELRAAPSSSRFRCSDLNI